MTDPVIIHNKASERLTVGQLKSVLANYTDDTGVVVPMMTPTEDRDYEQTGVLFEVVTIDAMVDWQDNDVAAIGVVPAQMFDADEQEGIEVAS